MSNIARDFATFMQDELSLGTFGTDIFIGGVGQDAPAACYWVIPAGGAPDTKNETGELTKNYLLNVFYRNTSQSDVYEKMQALEIELNKATCTNLENFDTIEIESILFPADQDIDNQERTIGLTQVRIKTYYKE